MPQNIPMNVLRRAVTNSSDDLTEPSSRPLVSWPLILALVVFVAGTMWSSVLADPDSYWHIAVGRWMVENRQLPTHDMFSYTVPGVAWTAHEWLSELVLFAAYQQAGFVGLTVLVSACFAVTAAYLMRFLFDRLEPIHAIPIGFVFLAVMSTHFLARPHVLVWPLTALWVGTLTEAGEQRRGPPWWLLIVLLLWANLHASYTLGLGLAAALAADAIWQRETMAERIATTKRWALFGAGCVVAVLCNPHGYGSLVHAVSVMGMKQTLALVNEWKSADFHEFQMLLLWVAMVLGLAFAGRLRLSPVRGLTVVGLLYLALKHQRYHATLGLISPFLLATPMAAGLPRDTAAQDGSARTVDYWMHLLARRSRPMGVMLVTLLAVCYGLMGQRGMTVTPVESNSPARALAAFAATGIKANVLNSYGFGGYLIYRGVPVFVDGRADMYGDAFITEVADALTLKGPRKLEQLIAKYHVGWTLLAPESPAVALLDHLPAWERLYSDSVSVVHVRRELLQTARATPSR